MPLRQATPVPEEKEGDERPRPSLTFLRQTLPPVGCCLWPGFRAVLCTFPCRLEKVEPQGLPGRQTSGLVTAPAVALI